MEIRNLQGTLQVAGMTQSQLLAKNPIPANKQEVVETDTLKRKIGDGVTAYAQLPYMTMTPQEYDRDGDGVVDEAKNAQTIGGHTLGISITDKVELNQIRGLDDKFAEITDRFVEVVKQSEVGQPNGVAPLNEFGKVDLSFLPQEVRDDVISGYFNSADNLFYSDAEFSKPITGETTNKLYIDKATDKQYKFDGSIFQVLLGSGLVIGTTTGTAGDGGVLNATKNLANTNKTAIADLNTRLDNLTPQEGTDYISTDDILVINGTPAEWYE